MTTRRDFLKQAVALSGAAGIVATDSIRNALAIEPERGSSFLDAEHVVILMQENRSFDHVFGSLQGVRGFNDPRAIRLPNGNPVWVQKSDEGKHHVPFRLDIRKSKTTWMGSLPHGWSDQVDAANGGKHDGWIPAKKSGQKDYAEMPLTMGYHTRADVPFYYALADAFTICDQNFCSTLTGTTPNRLHLWTGTIREKQSAASPALVRNENCNYGHWVKWTTFPERLEDHGVSWKIYQNELTIPTGLTGESDAWLSNFEDNPIEFFLQFHARFHVKHREHLKARIQSLPQEISELKRSAKTETDYKKIAELEATLKRFQRDLETFTEENFAKLTPREKSLHSRAFSTNLGDPAYRELVAMTYRDGDTPRTLNIPKGDILHQFRQDVEREALPTVSWLVPPESLSDHPCSAWYGSAYLSEVLEILTKNPAVWKKTIFILTYDENDGYFDHVPPFQAPHPNKPESGLASEGIDTSLEHVELDDDRRTYGKEARGNALGLGFRVPMIVASPWTRGGCVNSQVFDHTSVLQFLEKFATHKTGKPLVETNINNWRRTVCGDLTSVFQNAADATTGLTRFLEREPVLREIHKAQFEKLPEGYSAVTSAELQQIRTKAVHPRLPSQEPGTRRACPLPYQLAVDGKLDGDRKRFIIRMEASQDHFGKHSAGAAFIAYAATSSGLTVRHYTVAAGTHVEDSWPLEAFTNKSYEIRIHGPNGFFREYIGNSQSPNLEILIRDTEKASGNLSLTVKSLVESPKLTLEIRDLSYGLDPISLTVHSGKSATTVIESAKSSSWYDFVVSSRSFQGFSQRCAGHVETGRFTTTDPIMGRIAVSRKS